MYNDGISQFLPLLNTLNNSKVEFSDKDVDELKTKIAISLLILENFRNKYTSNGNFISINPVRTRPDYTSSFDWQGASFTSGLSEDLNPQRLQKLRREAFEKGQQNKAKKQEEHSSEIKDWKLENGKIKVVLKHLQPLIENSDIGESYSYEARLRMDKECLELFESLYYKSKYYVNNRTPLNPANTNALWGQLPNIILQELDHKKRFKDASSETNTLEIIVKLLEKLLNVEKYFADNGFDLLKNLDILKENFDSATLQRSLPSGLTNHLKTPSNPKQDSKDSLFVQKILEGISAEDLVTNISQMFRQTGIDKLDVKAFGFFISNLDSNKPKDREIISLLIKYADKFISELGFLSELGLSKEFKTVLENLNQKQKLDLLLAIFINDSFRGRLDLFKEKGWSEDPVFLKGNLARLIKIYVNTLMLGKLQDVTGGGNFASVADTMLFTSYSYTYDRSLTMSKKAINEFKGCLRSFMEAVLSGNYYSDSELNQRIQTFISSFANHNIILEAISIYNTPHSPSYSIKLDKYKEDFDLRKLLYILFASFFDLDILKNEEKEILKALQKVKNIQEITSQKVEKKLNLRDNFYDFRSSSQTGSDRPVSQVTKAKLTLKEGKDGEEDVKIKGHEILYSPYKGQTYPILKGLVKINEEDVKEFAPETKARNLNTNIILQIEWQILNTDKKESTRLLESWDLDPKKTVVIKHDFNQGDFSCYANHKLIGVKSLNNPFNLEVSELPINQELFELKSGGGEMLIFLEEIDPSNRSKGLSANLEEYPINNQEIVQNLINQYFPELNKDVEKWKALLNKDNSSENQKKVVENIISRLQKYNFKYNKKLDSSIFNGNNLEFAFKTLSENKTGVCRHSASLVLSILTLLDIKSVQTSGFVPISSSFLEGHATVEVQNIGVVETTEIYKKGIGNVIAQLKENLELLKLEWKQERQKKENLGLEPNTNDNLPSTIPAEEQTESQIDSIETKTVAEPESLQIWQENYNDLSSYSKEFVNEIFFNSDYDSLFEKIEINNQQYVLSESIIDAFILLLQERNVLNNSQKNASKGSSSLISSWKKESAKTSTWNPKFGNMDGWKPLDSLYKLDLLRLDSAAKSSENKILVKKSLILKKVLPEIIQTLQGQDVEITKQEISEISKIQFFFKSFLQANFSE